MQSTKPTLVILAAGMGSRYGGMKQMDTFSDEGDTIVDLSIYDAIEAGFGKIVFVIRKQLKEQFKQVFEKRWGNKIMIEYAYQEIDAIPINADVSQRSKPWGTGHALLVAKNKINENFALINADDFYGRQVFVKMAKQLNKTNPNSNQFCMIGFLLQNTLSDNGSVSRGQCFVDENGYLKEIIERTKIKKINDDLKANDSQERMFSISPETIVSMNFWGFTPKVFNYLEPLFLAFIKSNYNHLKTEFYLPDAIGKILKNLNISVQVLTTKSSWFGVTYPEDKAIVKEKIKKLKSTGKYPKHLWEN